MRPRPTEPVGLYDPAYEHDACGVAFVARLDGSPTHETVARALDALEQPRAPRRRGRRRGDRRRRRDPAPDPARVLRARAVDASCRRPGGYGVARLLPAARRRGAAPSSSGCSRRRVEAEGQRVLGWRDVPVDGRARRRDRAAASRRASGSSFIGAADGLDQDAFERKLYVIRRVAELAAGPDLVIPSFSSRTLVYKGMLTAPQLAALLPRPARRADRERARARPLALLDEHVPELGARAPVPHDRAQRRDQHAARQRRTGCGARESQLASELFGDDLAKVLPVVRPGGSDSATFDNVLELLVLAGRSLPHALMMMIPRGVRRPRRPAAASCDGFYAYHGCLIEPWDGPAAIAFTDGRVIGATLDRNGLRPGPLARDDGRLGRARLRGRRARRAGRRTPAQGPAAARQALPRRPRRRAASSPTRRSSARSRRGSRTREWFDARASCASPTCRRGAAARRRRAAAPAPARVRLHAGGHEGDARAARRERGGGGRLDGQRHAARRAVRSQRRSSTRTSSSSSRR